MSGAVRRIGATYRLQIRGIGFAGAAALVPYFSDLGVETLYLSPIFTARLGSMHGYDVVDPNEVDPALGGAAGLAELLGALDGAGMNLLVDIVPNHVATDPANAAFERALRDGPASSSGAMFDVDWEDQDDRIVLCVLDRPLADAVADGVVTVDPGSGSVATPGRSYPLAAAVDGREGAEGVLERQHYRLAYWRLRTSELNYRRFFEIDELIALRQEDPAVYRATHAATIVLAADVRVGGVRVDHVDGLTDPAGYLRRLSSDLEAATGERPAVLVEKILDHDEAMPHWGVEGTTGYEFADLALGVFVDGEGAATLSEEYRVRTGDPTYATRRRDAKRKVLDLLFPSQLERTARPLADALAAAHPGSDVARADVTRAVRELIAALGVYRTYGVGSAPVGRGDVAVLNAALREVRATSEGEVARAAALVAGMLTGGVDPPDPEFADGRRRFQQLAGAVMAKGAEDTALFDPGTPLVAAEVGGRPDDPAVSCAEFHAAMGDRARHPAGLSTTSTHDTKRSEDVRGRLAVLTEEPSQWLLTVDRWRRAHAALVGSCDVVDELYLYETIIGIAEAGRTSQVAFRRRVSEHLEKAAREAKRRTSWSDPDVAYERDLRLLVAGVLSPKNAHFHRDVDRVLRKIGEASRSNALGMTVLKVAAPGVPDIYQGTEAAMASLTDPDNRRTVDYAGLARALRRGAAPSSQVDVRKLAVTAAALRARREDPELFDRGRYVPLDVAGEQAGRVLAFARVRGRRVAVAVVTRLATGLAFVDGHPSPRAWGDTRIRLPGALAGTYLDVLSGSTVELGGDVALSVVTRTLPVSLLTRTPR